MPDPDQTTHLLVLDQMPLSEESDLYRQVERIAGVAQVLDLTIMEEWGIMPYGVFNPIVQEVMSKEEAIDRARRRQDSITPAKRRIVFLDGSTFGTVWVRMPLRQQVEERWPGWRGGLADG